MKRFGLGFRTIVCSAFLTAVAVAQQPTSTPAAPVPPAIRAAKKIFVSNGGADNGLFPSPFSGDPNRGYLQFYAELKTSGQYDLVDDPSDADLVLELHLIAPYGPTNGSKVNGAADPVPMFRLVVYDRKTHYVLWTLTQSIQIALFQKTHDRNFDEALTGILMDFEQLAGRASAAGQ
jgi:hypothetical protein